MSSLITRCPACATMFKVVPDQLRVSDGWVRCGQCNEVFDANSNLQPRADVAVNSRSAPLIQEPHPTPPPPPPSVAPTVSEVRSDARAGVKIVAKVEEKVEALAEVLAPPVAVIITPPAEPFLAVNPRALHIEPEPEALVAPPRPTTLGEQRSAVGRGEKPRRGGRREPAPQGVEEPPQHSFMKAGNASATWRKPWVRAVLWSAGLVLVVGLVLQIVIQERDRIAATEPSAVRLLEPLCGVLACKISPLRQIESIVIDSSSFAKVRADVFRLNFTLKNTAQTAIATPALELTLTDMQDQAVVRRIFVPTDFGRQQTVMEPGAELIASIPIAVKANTGNAKVSGYRLLSFYP